MDDKLLKQIQPKLPPKACMIQVMFIPDNDQQALDVKTVINKALDGKEVKRFSFNIEEHTPSK